MKKTILTICSLLLLALTACGGGDDPVTPPSPNPGPEPTPTPSQTAFVKGADISWYTEMAADGKRFYASDGTEMTCPQLMHSIGMDAVRLRVWVNPENADCQFCNTADVVTKAKAAKEAGMDVMIDFHYSDLWADPGRQQKPKAWEKLSSDELLQKVAEHTRTVLEAVKQAGVTPRWVQIGNETRNGMIYPDGALYDANWNQKADGWTKLVQLYSAGYNAAKSVLPEVKVMPHLNTASKQSDNLWWLQQFKTHGAKFDMVGFSHYPQTDDTSASPTTLNAQAIQCMKQVKQAYGVPVMVVEFGVRTAANESVAAGVTKDFMTQAETAGPDVCAGVFYWEPEAYGNWRPKSYTSYFDNWNAYDMGAFTSTGRPSSVLDSWKK